MSINARASIENVKRRVNDLTSFQLPRLERCNGPIGLYKELADEMRVDLASVRRSLEMSMELAHSEDRADLYQEVDGLVEEWKDLQSAYRTALITSKKNITSQARSRRHELLVTRSQSIDENTSSLKSPRTVGTSDDDALQTKTNEVTDALKRTTTLMQAELEKSVLSVQMLDESTRTLNLTQALYDNYTALLTTSTHLVKAIERADWYDRLLIFAAFAFFLLVVGWVIKRRVLDKVTGGLGWYIGGSYKLVRMGLGRRSIPKAVITTPLLPSPIASTQSGTLLAISETPLASPLETVVVHNEL